MLEGLIRHCLLECGGQDLAVTAGDEGCLIPHARQDLELASPFQARFEMWNVPARLRCKNTEIRGIVFVSHFLPPFPNIAERENVIDTKYHY